MSLNGLKALSTTICEQVADSVLQLEIQLYHRELELDAPRSAPLLCGSTVTSSNPETPLCCDMCLHPPESRVRATTFPMRDALLTTGPVPNTADEAGRLFTLQVKRMSRRQPFGIPVAAVPRSGGDGCVEPVANERRPPEESLAPATPAAPPSAEHGTGDTPAEGGGLLQRECSSASTVVGAFSFEDSAAGVDTVWVIKEDLPHLGLLKGDELLRANGTSVDDLDALKDALRNVMTLALELRRPAHLGPALRLDELPPVPAGSARARDDRSGGLGPAWLSDLLARMGLNCGVRPDELPGEEECVVGQAADSTCRTMEEREATADVALVTRGRCCVVP